MNGGPISADTLLQVFGPAGLFIGFLIWNSLQDRKERELRRLADVRLALALERFCQKFAGRSLPASGNDDVQT